MATKKETKSAPAKTRTVKTRAQRIEDAKAKLAELEAGVAADKQRQVDAIDKKLATKEPRLKKLQAEVDQLKADRAALVPEGEDGDVPATDGVGEPVED